ncbi:MAG: Rieske (2Fe-2S) protein [Candidatus Eremiobacteraeota bacterium]|nr:Rieske (2Fe-2S) protein [Candidatus Eremiobacteraeota bacterium]MBV8720951.1 Rieske (2Fe-2S) protein [Candidatus Eremiobacteraeota bacterium]
MTSEVRIEGRVFVRAAHRRAVTPERGTVVRVRRYEVALFDVGGDVVAYENACPHQGGPIGEGFVENGTVTCPWHAWCFDLRTGTLTLGDFARLRRFDVHVEGSELYVAAEPVEGSAW